MAQQRSRPHVAPVVLMFFAALSWPLSAAEKPAPAVDPCVEAGLAWLARHQEADGHWKVQTHESQQKTDTACAGLALLAFLRAGNTETSGRYKDNVRRGVAWLASKQNAKGLVFDGTDAGAHRGIGYPHAIAGMALMEAAARAKQPSTLSAAQKAVDYAFKFHQSDQGGFRYAEKQDGCISVSGWFVQMLYLARKAGLRLDPAGMNRLRTFLKGLEYKKDDVTLFKYRPDDPHESTAHRLAALGVTARLCLDGPQADVFESLDWALAKASVPGWGDGKTDLYFWYYLTQATGLSGGETRDKWQEAVGRTLKDNQCKDGDAAGSWNPVGDYALEWGRVGQTALACLCLLPPEPVKESAPGKK